MQLFKSNDYTKHLCEEWKLSIEDSPLKVEGEVLDPGEMVFTDKNVKIRKA